MMNYINSLYLIASFRRAKRRLSDITSYIITCKVLITLIIVVYDSPALSSIGPLNLILYVVDSNFVFN